MLEIKIQETPRMQVEASGEHETVMLKHVEQVDEKIEAKVEETVQQEVIALKLNSKIS